jgi:flavin reductase
MTSMTNGTTTIRQQFVEAMSRVASSVAIVTTDGLAGRLGLTVSAVTSVTADPPTLLVCINRKNPIEEAIRENGVFLISMLRADQRAIAQTFAGRPFRGNAYDFTASMWVDAPSGAPRLAGALGWFDCRLIATHQVGTHTIFIGRVEHAGHGEGMPLAYGRRSFAEILHLPEPPGPRGALPGPIWDEPIEEEWPE